MAARPAARRAAIAQARTRLLRQGWPRLQMLLIVALTALAGFLAAWAMLEAGIDTMALRYPLAVSMAYAVFLLLLWVWLRTGDTELPDITDLADLDAPCRRTGADWQGAGGHSGGGGADAGWSSSADASDGLVDGIAEPVGEALGAAASADELALPLGVVIVALATVAVLALSSLFVVWSAPMLFAELLVDGALAAGLYRRLRGIQSRHWLETAVRRTWLPFVLTALFAALVGWGLAQYAPGATTLGQARAMAASG